MTLISEARQRAIMYARSVLEQNPVFLDTETTGLDGYSEIVEISIVDTDGEVLFESLVRPSRPIPPEVVRVHHITNDMVRSAPTWPAIWPTIRSLLVTRLIGIYNDEFDVRMMKQSHKQYRLPWKDNFNTCCLMKMYAQYMAEWDPARRTYRYHSLDRAGKACGLSLPNSHRATADTLLARALLFYMAEIQQK